MFTASGSAVACGLAEWLCEHCARIFPQYSALLPFLAKGTVLVWKHLTKTESNSAMRNKSKGLRWWWGGVGVCGEGGWFRRKHEALGLNPQHSHNKWQHICNPLLERWRQDRPVQMNWLVPGLVRDPVSNIRWRADEVTYVSAHMHTHIQINKSL